MDSTPSIESLLRACTAMLEEVGGLTLPPDRLLDAGPLIAEIVAAIRAMDEADVDDLTPATEFRVDP